MEERPNWALVAFLGVVVGLIILGAIVVLFLAWNGSFRVLADAPAGGEFRSSGEMIYATGFNDRGERIPFTAGPRWLTMRGGGCAVCHGEDGQGGVPVMMLREVPSDIRYSHLLEEEEHGEGEEHPPYNDELIQRAITEGLDPAGERLDPSMPRWRMDEPDLDDLLAFLKTL